MSDETTLPAVQAEKRVPARVKSDVPIWDSDSFEHAQRVAMVLAKSMLVPEHLRGESHVSDLLLVCLIAQARNEHPLTVAQSVYFVKGRAGWNTTYLIAQANKSGVFRGPIRWRHSGEGKSLVVEAYATLADGGDEVSAQTSWEMARADGWTSNPKYTSMPLQMLRYRSATMLIRLYCPEAILAAGPSVEEVETMPAAGDAVSAPPATRSARETVAAKLGLGTTTIDVSSSRVAEAEQPEAIEEPRRVMVPDARKAIPEEPAVAARPTVAETVQRTAAEHEDPPRPARVEVVAPAPVEEVVTPEERERRLLYAEIKRAAVADQKGWQARTGRNTLIGVSRMGLDAVRELHALTFPTEPAAPLDLPTAKEFNDALNAEDAGPQDDTDDDPNNEIPF